MGSNTNFTEFYEANIDRVIGDGVISPDCCLYDRKLVASLIDSMGGPIEFADKINRIKRLQINFVQLDAVKQWHKFIDWSGEDSNCLAQLTNIWQYEINYLNTSGFTAQMNFIKLISELLEKHKEVYFTGNTPEDYITHASENAKLLTGIY